MPSIRYRTRITDSALRGFIHESMLETAPFIIQDEKLTCFRAYVGKRGSVNFRFEGERQRAGKREHLSVPVGYWAAMLAGKIPKRANDAAKRTTDAFVYLIKWGANYKIGRGDQL